jgi:fumarate reductase subunit D
MSYSNKDDKIEEDPVFITSIVVFILCVLIIYYLTEHVKYRMDSLQIYVLGGSHLIGLASLLTALIRVAKY